jgi:hypothetical protein
MMTLLFGISICDKSLIILKKYPNEYHFQDITRPVPNEGKKKELC